MKCIDCTQCINNLRTTKDSKILHNQEVMIEVGGNTVGVSGRRSKIATEMKFLTLKFKAKEPIEDKNFELIYQLSINVTNIVCFENFVLSHNTFQLLLHEFKHVKTIVFKE